MRYGVLLLLMCLISFPIASRALQGQVTETSAPDLIRSSWGKKLNPSGRIPDKGFKAIYFNRDAPGTVVFEENVGSVAIKYAWSEFHNIDSERFAAYWVGKLKFPAAAVKQISVSQGWAKSRIFIDGKIVFGDGQNEESFTYEFSAGEHVMEVEYINNWHTVEYKVTVDDHHEILDREAVAGYFDENPVDPANLYYVSLYESDSTDTRVDVTLPPTGKPVVLWLSSYEAIDWNISSSDPISAVVLASYSPGSRVTGETVGRVLRVKDSPRISSEAKRCRCSASGLYCEDREDLGDVASQLQDATNLELTGYALQYSAKALTVPLSNSSSIASRIQAARTATLTAQKQCVRRVQPDFDTMMK